MSTTSGFELLRTQGVPEISTKAYLFRHKKTGAELLALESDDENKTFAAAFRTLPSDNTGVAHILEHCVLGGTRKYPLREPFLELIKGSLATFVNALTYPDFTIYPVASTNTADFFNLMDVYLDAVFHPLLARHTFQQEGWHYEAEYPSQALLYRGIVFNEMKGAYANADDRVHTQAQMSLLPDTAYGVDSGGDPRHIPDLTFEALHAFYRRHYHPSNARLFLAGNPPLEESLRRIDEVLQEFEPATPSPTAALQAQFTAPRSIDVPYPAGPEGGKAYAVVGWALAENHDPARTLAFRILNQALVGSPASPLRRSLISSGLGEGLISLPAWLIPRQLLFFAGLKGLAPTDADKVERLVLNTLTELAQKGMDKASVEAAFNTVEFKLRENNAEGGQRGLELAVRALTTWLHHRDPLDAVAFEIPLTRLKAAVDQDPRYFEALIRNYLLENPHRVTVRLMPDSSLGERQKAEEAQRLTEAKVALGEAGIRCVVDEARALRHIQETPDPPEMLARLPMVTKDQLERTNRPIPAEPGDLAGMRALFHPLPTNGILYLDLGFDLRHLPCELVPLADLFGRAVLEMGTDTLDHVQLAQRIEGTTGGIHVEAFASESRAAASGPVWLFLRGKSTLGHARDLAAILVSILEETRLDNPTRFREILLEEKARCETDLLGRAYIAVTARLRGHFGEVGWADDQLNWFGHLMALQQLAQDVLQDWPRVLARLEMVRTLLVNRQAMIANVTVDGSAMPAVFPHLSERLGKVPSTADTPIPWQPGPLTAREGFSLPSQVNYVGKGLDLYRHGYRQHGSSLAIAHYLTFTWIWDQLRVQGGAYGGGADFDLLSGVLAYSSYRDPNLLETLERFDGTAGFIRSLDLSEAELTKSIIGGLRALDPYMLPDAKGFASLTRTLSGQTEEYRQALRDELLGATPADFAAFAEALEAASADEDLVLMGSSERLEKADHERGGDWIDIRPVL